MTDEEKFTGPVVQAEFEAFLETFSTPPIEAGSPRRPIVSAADSHEVL